MEGMFVHLRDTVYASGDGAHEKLLTKKCIATRNFWFSPETKLPLAALFMCESLCAPARAGFLTPTGNLRAPRGCIFRKPLNHPEARGQYREKAQNPPHICGSKSSRFYFVFPAETNPQTR
jgi:hypothetical protein